MPLMHTSMTSHTLQKGVKHISQALTVHTYVQYIAYTLHEGVSSGDFPTFRAVAAFFHSGASL